jgi:hypothetical protein
MRHRIRLFLGSMMRNLFQMTLVKYLSDNAILLRTFGRLLPSPAKES